MVDIQREVSSTKAFFNDHHIPLSDEWLESCINWFREEQNGVKYTENQLHSIVYDQWLVFDLREVQVPQLPDNIQGVTKFVLDKTVVLQMLSIVDISKPKLQQLNKIKNANPLTRGFDDENTLNNNYSNISSNRMLQLTLTDGVQEIKAIEFKPISQLSLNLNPGIKIKIIAPITIRRGTMMMESHNVKLLGGEVEEILVSNAAENVLARFLNLPENPNPRSVNDLSVNESRIAEPTVNLNLNVNKKPVQSNILNYDKPKEVENLENVFMDDDDDLIALEIDSLLEKNNLSSTPKLTIKPKSPAKEENFNSNEDFRITQEIDMLLEAERDILKDKDKKTKIVKEIKQNEPSLSDVIDLDDELFASLEIDRDFSDENKIYTLGEITRLIGDNRPGKYRTFGKFKSVVEKLTVSDEGWELKISIESENDDLTVKMDSLVITELIGYSPEEVMGMKRDIQQKNAETTNLILKAMDGFRLKLLDLSCLLEIEYDGGDKIPRLTKLL